MSDLAREFIKACSQGEVQKVKSFLASPDFDVNKLDHSGRTGIVIAAQSRQLAVVELLVNAGADVNLPDGNGLTPLHHAASRGQKEMTELLLCHNARVDIQDLEGQTALMLAVGQGHTSTATPLLKAGSNPEIVDENGQTALFKAVHSFRSAMIGLLLDYGANMEHRDHKGRDIYTELNKPATSTFEFQRHKECHRLIDKEMQRRAYMQSLVEERREGSILSVEFKKSFLTDRAAMLSAAASDQFSAYLDQKIRQGKYIDLEMMTLRNDRGVSVIDMLCFRENEKAMLRPSLWEKQMDELKKFHTKILKPWQQVKYRHEIESLYQQIRVGQFSRKTHKPMLKKRSS